MNPNKSLILYSSIIDHVYMPLLTQKSHPTLKIYQRTKLGGNLQVTVIETQGWALSWHTVISEIFVRVKILFSSVLELSYATRWLVAMEPQASYDRRRHRNCFPTRKSASISEKVNISWGIGQLMRSSPASIYMTINMLSVTDFVRKWIISGSEFKPASIWTCWMQIDRQICSQRSCRNFTGGFRSWLPTTCMLVHQEIFWSPW